MPVGVGAATDAGAGQPGNQLDIGNWYGCILGLALDILEHLDLLRNASHRSTVGQHLSWKVNEVDCMKDATSCIEVVNKISSSDGLIKGLCILEVFVPQTTSH